MSTTVAATPAQAPSSTTAAPAPESSGGSGSVQLKRAMADKPLAVQMAMLTPHHRDAVQMKGGGDAAGVHEAAARGVASGGGAMPYADQIQRSFGGNDVSHVQAHTGGAAQDASSAMGAEAFASGDHVVFGGAPDLHTAAHEAAHVVQQQAGVSLAGGVGQVGDKYEQHADKVADAVVQGKSAEPILAEMGGAGGGGEVQRVQRRGVHRAVQAKETQAPVQRVETTPVTGPRVPAGAEVNLTGQSMSAPSADNPNFDEDAKNFENLLGGLAMARGQAHATTMCNKALTYMKNKAAATVTATEGVQVKLNALLAQCAMTKASFAGAVGADATTIQFIASDIAGRQAIVEEALAAGRAITLFQSPPNVREQMTFLYNAGIKIIGPDLLRDGSAAVSALLGSTEAETAALAAKTIEIEQLAAERAGAGGDATPTIGDAAWGVPNRPETSAGIVGDQTTSASGATTTAAVPAAAATSRAVVGQHATRVTSTDVANTQNPGRTDQAGDEAKTGSTRRADSLPPGAGVSERELATMSIAPTDVLKWGEGDKRLFMNEKNAWIQAIRELGLPLGGGPSGTTTAIMNTNELVGGTTAENARLCAMGYLLPIHAHSLVEIMAAASAFGAGFTAGRQMYMNIPPLGADELRGLGRSGGADGKKLFPHESPPAPPSAVSAAAPPSGAPVTPAPVTPATPPSGGAG